jgi:P-type Cu2+ transporter
MLYPAPVFAPVLAPPAATGSASVLDDELELARYTRWITGRAGERQGVSTFQIAGMVCAACAGIIEAALRRVDGVLDATVSAAGQRATVRWDPRLTQPSALIGAVRAAGYDAAPDAAAPARELRRAENRSALWRFFVASFCAMQVMMFATPSYVAGPGELPADLRQLLNWGSWVVTLPVMWFAAAPFFGGAWRGLRQGRIGMDVPVALAVLVTFVASTGATFDPDGVFGHEVYFDSLTMFVAFLLGGRWFEVRARHRAAESLESAVARLPDTAQRLDADGTWQEVSVQRLRPGDMVRVALGQAFPADGVLVNGETAADESLLTGESRPVPKAALAPVVAGSVNVGAPVEMRVERAGADTRFEAIVTMMRDAMAQRPAMARLADRWASPFLLVVLLLAAGAGAVWSVIDPSRAIAVAVAVLIVTCPCALSLAAPATLVAAAGGLARRGVLFSRLDAIEVLARTRCWFFDKTGTLTEGRLQLRAVVPLACDVGGDAAALLATAASLAAWSRHPLSRTLVHDCTAPQAIAWSAVEERPGFGLRAVDEAGVEWRLGSPAWVGLDAASVSDSTTGAAAWLSRADVVVARFDVDEVLREGARDTIAALRADGGRVSLLSGDSARHGAALAGRLDFDTVIAGASPAAKLAAVAEAQADGGPVAMVGDGVNDAPVLARADVSLAMGQGALVSRAQADAVIVSNRPLDIVRARDSARKAVRIVHQNLWWAALYNAVCIPLALLGYMPPWAAGLGMAASSLLVIANAARAAR